jgi:hypothetical protein
MKMPGPAKIIRIEGVQEPPPPVRKESEEPKTPLVTPPEPPPAPAPAPEPPPEAGPRIPGTDIPILPPSPGPKKPLKPEVPSPPAEIPPPPTRTEWTGDQFDPKKELGKLGEGGNPAAVVGKMLEKGAPFAEVYSFIGEHPGAERGLYGWGKGATAGRTQEEIFKQLEWLNKAPDKAQFDYMVDTGAIPKGSKYVAPEKKGEPWKYIPSGAKPAISKEFVIPATVVLKKADLTFLKENYPKIYKVIQSDGLTAAYKKYGDIIEQSRWESNLQKESPALYKVYKAGRIEAYNAEIKMFEVENIKLKFGDYISRESYDALSKYQQELINKIGVVEFNNRYDAALESLSPWRAAGDKGEVGYDLNRALWDSLSEKNQEKLAYGQTTVDTILPKDIQEKIKLVFGEETLQESKGQLSLSTAKYKIGPAEKYRGRIEAPEVPKMEAPRELGIGPLSVENEVAMLRNEVQRIDTKTLSKEQQALLMARDIGLSLIPGVVPYQKVQEYKEGGFTVKEIVEIVGWSALDLLILIPVIGGLSAGARAAKGLGATARAKAIGKATGQIALAEIKAPYTAIRHPIKTLKTLAEPIETIFRARKVPLSAVENRFTTVRLPVNALGDELMAMRLRDIAVSKAIRGEKAIAKIGNTTIELSPTALQKLGTPCAVHTTPDIRPFLEGAMVQTGREGGLFVSPSVHSRFSLASAFGNMPQDGIRGALLIRDEKVLKGLTPSGKIYRGTAEIEAVLREGVKLGNPSQLLMTRDMGGDKLVLAIFGDPFTASQIAKLKFIGSTDTLKQIFTSPAKVTKTELAASKSYDGLLDIRRQIAELLGKSKQLRKQGKAAKAAEAEAELVLLQRRSAEIARRISGRLAGRIAMAMAGLNFQERGLIERMDSIARRRVTAKPIRRLPDIELDRATVNRLGRIRISPKISARARILPAAGRRQPIVTPRGEPPAVPVRAEPIAVSGRKQVPTQIERPIVPLPKKPAIPGVPSVRAPRDIPERPLPPTIPDTDKEKPRPIVPSKPKTKRKQPWTEKEVRSAIAWKSGFVIHAIKSPYRRGIDERSFHVDNIPPDLRIPRIKNLTGEGSPQASARVTGDFPKTLTVDMGNQDITITREPRRKVRMRFTRDTRGSVSGTTISKKRGRVYHTKAGGGTILSRRPLRGYS